MQHFPSVQSGSPRNMMLGEAGPSNWRHPSPSPRRSTRPPSYESPALPEGIGQFQPPSPSSSSPGLGSSRWVLPSPVSSQNSRQSVRTGVAGPSNRLPRDLGNMRFSVVRSVGPEGQPRYTLHPNRSDPGVRRRHRSQSPGWPSMSTPSRHTPPPLYNRRYMPPARVGGYSSAPASQRASRESVDVWERPRSLDYGRRRY
ncbi:hypothetical protein BAUCODRAFT_204476 [Baudoinia panamericana UAMH 10762]|uniref:Uncharacterized protein n=1 Tax=Baudoinia panamericana (strain UAMH 10762) TaxID=717646 RepID=M2NQE0_BAUPA|nr:uncharacterized protein BAUCODRAFT_204476 [Baudoinia panamericana UAMH 10762]EMD01266.1 hypothetical protein BAUCODRAFT_204476 [Baudoinia panamericana UAMH 10762]